LYEAPTMCGSALSFPSHIPISIAYQLPTYLLILVLPASWGSSDTRCLLLIRQREVIEGVGGSRVNENLWEIIFCC